MSHATTAHRLVLFSCLAAAPFLMAVSITIWHPENGGNGSQWNCTVIDGNSSANTASIVTGSTWKKVNNMWQTPSPFGPIWTTSTEVIGTWETTPDDSWGSWLDPWPNNGQKDYVWAQSGEYKVTVTVMDDVTLEEGFDETQWIIP